MDPLSAWWSGFASSAFNTTATLWCSAAVGTLAGSGLSAEAATLAGFVLAGNTLLRPLVNWVNRRLIDASVTGARYLVRLVPTTAKESELDAVVAALEASPLILSATWSVEATS